MGRLLPVLLFALVAAAEPRIVVPDGHRGWILGADFREDGEVVAVVDRGGGIRLWETATGRVLAALEPSPGILTGAAFARGGARLVTGATNGSAQVWDAPRAKLLRTDASPGGGGYCGVAVAPDGARFAHGCDGFVVVRGVDDSAAVRRFPGPREDRFWAVAFSPEGTHLAAASAESVVYVWPLDGSGVRRLDHDAGEVVALAFHPDGTHLLACVREGRVHRWNWRTGGHEAALPGDGAIGLALDRNGAQVAVGRTNGQVTLYAWPGTPCRVLDAHADWVRTLAFSPDGKTLLTGGDDGRVHLWDPVTGERRRSLEGATVPPLSVAEAPGGAVRVAMRDRMRLRVLDLRAGSEAWGLDGVAEDARAALSVDGTHVVVVDRDGARVFPLAGGEAASFRARPRGAFALGPGGARLAARVGAGEVAVWSRTERIATLPGNADTDVLGLGFDPSGELLAQGGKGAYRAIHRIASGACLGRGRMSMGWIASFAFDRGGQHLLAGGPYAVLTLCTRDEELTAVRRMEGHRGGIRSVAFAAGDRRLLSAGTEGTLRLWDAATGAHLATAYFLEGGGWLVTTPDGRYDAGGGAERLCRVVDDDLAPKPLDTGGRTPGLFAALLE